MPPNKCIVSLAMDFNLPIHLVHVLPNRVDEFTYTACTKHVNNVNGNYTFWRNRHIVTCPQCKKSIEKIEKLVAGIKRFHIPNNL